MCTPSEAEGMDSTAVQSDYSRHDGVYSLSQVARATAYPTGHACAPELLEVDEGLEGVLDLGCDAQRRPQVLRQQLAQAHQRGLAEAGGCVRQQQLRHAHAHRPGELPAQPADEAASISQRPRPSMCACHTDVRQLAIVLLPPRPLMLETL